ncbi:MAG: hypothetical protein ABWW69_03320 [Pyrodictiaceae archaeon]
MPRPKRRLIAVSEDIINALIPVARRMGVSIQELVEIILGSIVRVASGRDNLDVFLMEALIRNDMASLGGLVIPFSLFIKIINGLDGEKLEELYEELENYAKIVASIAKTRGIEGDIGVKLLLKQWLVSLPASIEVTATNDGWRLLIASPMLSNEKSLEAITRIAEAAVNGLGYSISSIEKQPGLIVLTYRRGNDVE